MNSSNFEKLKIGFLTTSRADLGIQAQIIKKISNLRAQVETHILVACAQLGPGGAKVLRDFELGHIRSIIQLEGTEVAEDDWATAVDLISTMGPETYRAIHGAGLDKLVILGDRYEVVGAAYAAAMSPVELVHIHGGDVTEGAIDEYFRHAISKLSNTHIVTSSKSKSRLIKMGENPESVHVAGPLGAESLTLQPWLSPIELERRLGLALSGTNVLLAFHPETLSEDYGIANLERILRVIEQISDCSVLITGTNSDPGSERIGAIIQEFSKRHPQKVKFVSNLGSLLFANVLRHFDLLIGNSSSGLLEAPAFPIRVVNVGSRQTRRDSIGPVRHVAGDYETLSVVVLDSLRKEDTSVGESHLSYQGKAPSDRAVETLLTPPIKDKTKIFYDYTCH